jgi:16S rRNA A1518/A1519 N6-dimethyltransferase RsmA/KsgA/DIM1 with predicted DNA glycosylase/AP lyase activity
LVFKKEFGQHILKNPLVVQGIVEKVVGSKWGAHEARRG